jgi:uncharacterized phage protein (TIGR02218 family)
MKTSTTLPTALATNYASGTPTTGDVLKIVRKDGAVYAFTSFEDDVTISGQLYSAAQGLDISSIEISAGLAVDNLELTTLDDGSTFSRIDVLSGRWNNAKFMIGRYNWASPADGIELRLVGTIGNVQLKRGQIVAELRGLQQALQQPIGSVLSKTCRARLGDSMCTKSLTAFTFSGSVTSVASNQAFTDSTKAQAADYFAQGILTWTSGPNNGLAVKVKGFSAAKQFTLSLPMISAIAIGHTFSVVAGCQKRLTDCSTKFSNVLNFQGEPHLPGIDALTS